MPLIYSSVAFFAITLWRYHSHLLTTNAEALSASGGCLSSTSVIAILALPLTVLLQL